MNVVTASAFIDELEKIAGLPKGVVEMGVKQEGKFALPQYLTSMRPEIKGVVRDVGEAMRDKATTGRALAREVARRRQGKPGLYKEEGVEVLRAEGRKRKKKLEEALTRAVKTPQSERGGLRLKWEGLP
jgi:hypothetical protein